MRYAKYFPKTFRQTKNDETNVSSKLLYQAGYIRESTAGRYYFMPLGIKVRSKIIEIIRREMNRSNAIEMITPVLHPLELWKETNRTESAGFELTTLKDRRGAEFALGGTAEEMVVDVVRREQVSYKDLPFNLYQFSTKFRDELRSRGGLLRVREFIMKDAYSFSPDEESFKIEYRNMMETYTRIFKALGLETDIVESDGGYIGGDYCHEFVVESEVGESTYLVNDNGSYSAHEDVAVFEHRDINSGDSELPFEIIEQPQWVKTMYDNEKHYKLPKERFLKNVVYKRHNGSLVIATIRGDLEVNPIKLQHVIGDHAEIQPASEEDLASIGTKSGYVHSWGYSDDVLTVGDLSLKTVKNFVGGQKEDRTDSRNVNYGRDFTCQLEGDIALAKEGFLSKGGGVLKTKKGIEVGNIFQLGYHYSKPMNATYTDQDSQQKPYYMGCYGIGVGRTLATIVEKFNDKDGIVWPRQIAPFEVHFVSMMTKEEGDNRYSEFLERGVDVLFDDREGVSFGVKMKDADLIGVPLRVIESNRSREKGGLEVKVRETGEIKILSMEEVILFVREFYG